MIKISPSILSANFAYLGAEIQKLEQAGADMIHIDVMDGHFVPNLTFGPPVIKSLRAITSLPFDVHLMIDNPAEFISEYADAGADIITVHYESLKDVRLVLNQIKSFNKQAGISLLPTTEPEILESIIDQLDLILVMTVNPGFGGQKFMEEQLPKIKYLADKIKQINRDTTLAVDGGINDITAKECINAGASMLVAGSYIFQGNNYAKNINNLRAVC